MLSPTKNYPRLKTFLRPAPLEKPGMIVLALLWVGAQVIAYLNFGVITSVDTETYLIDAQLIIDGGWPEGGNIYYSTYSLLLAIVLVVAGNPHAIVILHICCSGLAAAALYKLTQDITRHNVSAFTAAFLYIIWPEIHQWNMIVYTDSIFSSAAVVSVTSLYFSKSWKHYLLAFLLIVLTIFIRPTGIIFSLALLGYCLSELFHFAGKRRHMKTVAITCAAFFALLMLNFVLKEHVTSLLASYMNAEIIYPKITLGIARSDELYIPAPQYPPLFRLFLFMAGNPFYFLKISLMKILLFIGHAKPYYSALHNIAIGLFLYPVYLLSIKGWWGIPQGSLKVFITLFLFLQVALVGFTSENWDGRFMLPLLPWLFILASVGISDFPAVKGVPFSKSY